MEENKNKKGEYWCCDNPKCNKVLAGYFDGNEFRTKTINGQEIVITEFETAKLTAKCQHCGYENVFSGKQTILDDMAMEEWEGDPNRK